MKYYDKLRFTYENTVSDIVSDVQFQQTRSYIQHGFYTRFDHCYRVSSVSFILCGALGLNREAAARGGLLHDFYLYDVVDIKSHIINHPRDALHNSQESFHLSDKEKNIILSHMWPLTATMPHCPEAVIVGLVDTVCATGEYIGSLIHKIHASDRQKSVA